MEYIHFVSNCVNIQLKNIVECTFVADIIVYVFNTNHKLCLFVSLVKRRIITM